MKLSSSSHLLSRVAYLSLCLGAVVACGARTGLEEFDAKKPDAAFGDASLKADAAQDADAKLEADVKSEPDVMNDTAVDVTPDVYKTDCTDPTVTYVYVVSNGGNLFSFRPNSMSFSYIGHLDCMAGSTPFSMAVDRKGIAHIVSSSGQLFRAKIADASCKATSWNPGTDGYSLFGMGYSTDEGGPSEKLYLAASGLNSGPLEEPKLGWLDTTTYAVKTVGPLDDSGMELTGTGDNRLFGFYPGVGNSNAHLVQLDKKSGKYLEDTELPKVTTGSGWAFAFWGGEFWFFTTDADDLSSTVTRYNPGDKKPVVVATLPQERIVGAGVSTCAPEK